MHHSLVGTISSDRLGTYLGAAGHDLQRALDLYLWNAAVGAAFHLPIQTFEIALRNRIDQELRKRFGGSWAAESEFLSRVSFKSRQRINGAQARIPGRATHSQIIANTSLGFWVSLLKQERLELKVFSEVTSIFIAAEILFLRNRIFHHEPIFKRDLLADYGLIMKLLYQLCPATHNWIRPHCRVPALVRQKP